MTNWRTSLMGLLTAGFGFVLFSPELFQHWPWLIALSKYATAGGLAGIGLFAKDSSTHSTREEVQDATIEHKIAEDRATAKPA